MENLVCFADFNKNWKPKEQKVTKRTETGIDVFEKKKFRKQKKTKRTDVGLDVVNEQKAEEEDYERDSTYNADIEIKYLKKAVDRLVTRVNTLYEILIDNGIDTVSKK